MLYLIKIGNDHRLEEKYKTYHLFETHTESFISGESDFVIQLLEKYNFEAVNFCIGKGKIKVKQWPHKIRTTSDSSSSLRSLYILLTKQNEQTFKIVSSNGRVHNAYSDALKTFIRQDQIANCNFIRAENLYKSIDTYKTDKDTKFEKYIDTKYEEFRAKTLMVGLDISFRYVIEGKDVKLTNYTGTSRKIIIPSFITTIGPKVFRNIGIAELILSEGLKYIGCEAFRDKEIAKVKIPKSVKIIGRLAFYSSNTSLMENDGYTKDAIDVQNKQTIIIDNI